MDVLYILKKAKRQNFELMFYFHLDGLNRIKLFHQNKIWI